MISCHVYIVKYEYDDQIYLKIEGDVDEIVPMIASAIIQNETMKDGYLVAQTFFSTENKN